MRKGAQQIKGMLAGMLLMMPLACCYWYFLSVGMFQAWDQDGRMPNELRGCAEWCCRPGLLFVNANVPVLRSGAMFAIDVGCNLAGGTDTTR